MSGSGIWASWSRAVANGYGRKQGFMAHHWSRAVERLGGYDAMRTVDLSAVHRLVFVCQGNICRSRYAEARAQTLGLAAASFGLGADGRAPADPAAVRAAWARGLALAPGRSRGIEELDLGPGDLLVAMEPAHARALGRFARESGAQRTLLGLWEWPGRPYLGDPYGLSAAYFDTCFRHIDVALTALAARCGSAHAA